MSFSECEQTRPKVNARLYSPYLGRFVSPDPLLNSEGGPLDYNPYIYARNNPYKYIDRNGEFWWLVATIGAEALLGGATYSISAAITGEWNVGDFFKSMGVSAVSAGLSAGFGVLLGPSVGNQLAYGLLSSTSNYFITSAIYGEKISFADIPGIVVGAAVNSSLPTFSPSGSNPFVNALSEITFNTVRGAITGFASGTINAMVHDDPSLVLKGAAGGAISGGIRTAMHNAIFGAQYQPLTDKNEPVPFPAKGAYRKGGIAGYMMHKLNRGGSGLTLGRNLFTVEKGEDYESIMDTRYHENIHLQQINHLGVARFYGTLFLQYMKYGFGKGPLERDAYKNEDKWRNF